MRHPKTEQATVEKKYIKQFYVYVFTLNVTFCLGFNKSVCKKTQKKRQKDNFNNRLRL